MVQKELIENIVEQVTRGTDLFHVETRISISNKITIAVDSMKGITIDQCGEISKLVEASLNREEEDFEIEVSSPGLSEPFKVINQYRKNIGQEVEIVTEDGQQLKGKLLFVSESGITIEALKKIKTSKHQKKQIVLNNISIVFENIKKTKLILSF